MPDTTPMPTRAECERLLQAYVSSEWTHSQYIIEMTRAYMRTMDAASKVAKCVTGDGRFCPQHQTLAMRFPLCGFCQLEARIEEMAGAIRAYNGHA